MNYYEVALLHSVDVAELLYDNESNTLKNNKMFEEDIYCVWLLWQWTRKVWQLVHVPEKCDSQTTRRTDRTDRGQRDPYVSLWYPEMTQLEKLHTSPQSCMYLTTLAMSVNILDKQVSFHDEYKKNLSEEDWFVNVINSEPAVWSEIEVPRDIRNSKV